MPFYYNGTLGGEGGGSIPDPSLYGGRQLAIVNPNTAQLPSDPADLVKNNYVIVDRNLDDSVFPFTIDSITFLSKYDSAIYNGSQWELQSGIQNTLSVRVIDRASESLSGNSTTQQEINQENRKELQDLRSRAQILVGYFSSTEPTGAEEEDLWFETSASHDTGDDLPTTFPIQVKEYKNGAWSATTKDYTANNNDLWSNLNNRHGYYWFGNTWNLTDAAQPNLDPDDLEWNSANQITIKNGGVRFDNINSDSIANGLENDNQKLVKADDLYNTAIVSNTTQTQAKAGGGRELSINLKNSAGTSITEAKTDIDTTATQNSTNLIDSNAVYKEELSNSNSSQTCSYDTTSKKLQLTTQLKNNNNDSKVNKTTNLISKGTDYASLSDTDKLSYFNITTQELKDVALSAVNTYIQNKLNGAISTVLTDNLTANKILSSNANGKITASYDLKTSTGSTATDTQIPTNKLLYDNTKKLTTNSFTKSRGVYVDSNGNLATESVNLTAKTTSGLTQHKISQRGLITEYTSIGVDRSLNIKDNNLGINNTITANTTDGIKTFKVNAQGLITAYTAKTLGRGLKDDSNVIGHSNTAVTAKTNTNIAGVSYDAYGHITGKGTEYSVQTSMPSSPTDSQFLTAKVVYDGFAPRQTTYISGEYSVFIDANDAVFNFPTSTPNTRATDIMQFLVILTDPISNATIWGNCETRIIVNNHDGGGAGVEIYQTVICMGNTSKFYRKGTLNPAQDITKIYENRSNIVWWAWYPIDYPLIYLSSLLNKTDFNSGRISLAITGGVALFDLSYISPKSTKVKDIIVSAEFRKYSQFFKSTAEATLSNLDNPLNGGILMVRVDGGLSLKCERVGTVNNNYSGQLVATLGYR